MRMQRALGVAAVTLIGGMAWAQAEPPPGPPLSPQAQPPPLEPPLEPPPAASASPSPPVDPPPPVAPPAVSVRAPETACEPNWFPRVYAATYRSVVRIDTGRGGLGAGFVFHSREYVATAYHVVADEREIRVSFVGGHETEAEVVSIDEKNDLALLSLTTPPQPVGKRGQPLPTRSTEKIALGTPVLVIGHPYATADDELARLLTWSVSQGIVSGNGERLLQTDAAINPGNSGGPLIDCDGRVLGVVSAKLHAEGIGFVIPAQLLDALLQHIGPPIELGITWRPSLQVALGVHGSVDEALLGFDVGAGAFVDDRWEARFGVGVGWRVLAPDLPPEVLSQNSRRVTLRLIGGYHWQPLRLLGIGAHLGAAATQTQVDETRLAIGPANTIERSDSEVTEWMGYPLAGADLWLLGTVRLSYSFLPDFTDVGASIHQGLVAIPVF